MIGMSKNIHTFKNRWIRPTGNWRPAFTERDVGLRLSPFLEDMVPLAPLPESPLPESPLAPLPDMFCDYGTRVGNKFCLRRGESPP